MLTVCFACRVWSQSPAALQRLSQRYDAVQLEDLRTNTHYKYVGLLLFYESSFLVVDGGQLRVATEDEILSIDLDGMNGLRSVEERVQVANAVKGRDIVLLSRNEFEALFLSHANAEDKAAYLAYKSQQERLFNKSSN